NNLGVIAKELSRWSSARELYDRAQALYELTGDRPMACLAQFNVAEILTDQGRYDEAERLLRDVLRVWRALGADTDAAFARGWLGKVFARRGEMPRALEALEGARAQQLEHGQTHEILATD